MKILHIPNYYNPHIGGIEQVAEDIVESLRNEKNEQMVICFSNNKFNKEDVVNGIPVRRIGYFFKFRSQALTSTYFHKLKKTIKEFQPDIIHFHYPNPLVSTALLKTKTTAKIFVHWHADIVAQKILGKLFIKHNDRLLARADKIVATSVNYIDGSQWLTKFKDKVTVINCAINFDRIKPNAKSNIKKQEILDLHKGKNIIFAVGRHVEYKGIKYLIEASKYLDDKYSVIVGGVGPLTEKLKDMAESDSKVIFVGKLSLNDLIGYYSACTVFAFPSITKNEAFGLALGEAMSFGKPAVTFTIPGSGVNYVSVNNETGLEVENGNSEAFAMAIKKICENQDLYKRFSKAAKERVTSKMSFDVFKENIIKLYNEN